MERLIELKDQDYQYCLDYASGMTNILAFYNTSKVIKAVADGTQYEARLKSDMVVMFEELQSEIRHFMYDINPSSSESDYACNYMIDNLQQKINALKENEYGRDK